jgi:hypothetical protein
MDALEIVNGLADRMRRAMVRNIDLEELLPPKITAQSARQDVEAERCGDAGAIWPRACLSYDPAMSESDKPLREQLDDAIAVVQRDLEILRSPSSIGGGADNRSVIADLETELCELKEARANVGPHDA